MDARSPATPLEKLLAEIRACRHCAAQLPHAPRPVVRASSTARLAIVGQAPGTRVHASGVPFTDPSGDRLRDWMGVDADTFYDENLIAIAPMGFCFPGLNEKGGDLPPRRECAPLWQGALFKHLPSVEVVLLVGLYAQNFHLPGHVKSTLTETVRSWREYTPYYFPLPHPSWRNNAWLKRNAWFSQEVLPELRHVVANTLRF